MQLASITIKRTSFAEPGDNECVQIFIIILRECLASLHLESIRNNYCIL